LNPQPVENLTGYGWRICPIGQFRPEPISENHLMPQSGVASRFEMCCPSRRRRDWAIASAGASPEGVICIFKMGSNKTSRFEALKAALRR
jgi:hypothetical protein